MKCLSCFVSEMKGPIAPPPGHNWKKFQFRRLSLQSYPPLGKKSSICNWKLFVFRWPVSLNFSFIFSSSLLVAHRQMRSLLALFSLTLLAIEWGDLCNCQAGWSCPTRRLGTLHSTSCQPAPYRNEITCLLPSQACFIPSECSAISTFQWG